MKQARKKELKTNELSIYLQQIQEAVVRHANYIIGGVVAVVLILMIGLYVQSSRHQTENARWNELTEIKEAAATEIKPETLDRAERLADETGNHPYLGPETRELVADLAYQKALQTSPVSNAAEYENLLKKAQASYQTLARSYASRPDIVARAKLGLASTYESLSVVGKADIAEAKKQYEEVAKSDNETYSAIAQSRLDTLPERTKPLKIVATLPAEPVETAPAAATGPAEATVAPTTAPASAPQ